MFDSRPENRVALDRAWKALEPLKRGDTIEHERMEELLGVARDDHRYYALIEKLKRQLLADRGILLSNIMLIGYELAKPSRQLLEAEVRERRAGRHRRKGLAAIESLPVDECSFEEQRQRNGLAERLALAVRQSREESARIQFLMRPKQNQPPRIAREEEQTG